MIHKLRALVLWLQGRERQRAAARARAQKRDLRLQKLHRQLQVELMCANQIACFPEDRRVVHRAKEGWKGSTLYGFVDLGDHKTYNQKFRIFTRKTMDYITEKLISSGYIKDSKPRDPMKQVTARFKVASCMYYMARTVAAMPRGWATSAVSESQRSTCTSMSSLRDASRCCVLFTCQGPHPVPLCLRESGLSSRSDGAWTTSPWLWMAHMCRSVVASTTGTTRGGLRCWPWHGSTPSTCLSTQMWGPQGALATMEFLLTPVCSSSSNRIVRRGLVRGAWSPRMAARVTVAICC